jgi:hypothetical protein
MQHNVVREFVAIPFVVVKKLVNATIATHLNPTRRIKTLRHYLRRSRRAHPLRLNLVLSSQPSRRALHQRFVWLGLSSTAASSSTTASPASPSLPPLGLR